ncbi:MAG: ZIP family metal transporter [Thermodesulfobacteriota bacterium]
MQQLVIVLLASWLAGATAFLGAVIGRLEGSAETELKQELVHGIIAFGGGILLAAVALALVPEGMNNLSALPLTIIFCTGGIIFCRIDAHLASKGGSKAQFLAMLMDFVPEAISLGAVFSHNRDLGIVLAVFIGAQNLPEGFNSFRELVAAKLKSGQAMLLLLAASLLGPLAACAGYFLLQGQAQLTAGIMIFASGGIIYLIFQDIAPQASMLRHWTPPLGAVLGFTVGMLGQAILG